RTVGLAPLPPPILLARARLPTGRPDRPDILAAGGSRLRADEEAAALVVHHRARRDRLDGHRPRTPQVATRRRGHQTVHVAAPADPARLARHPAHPRRPDTRRLRRRRRTPRPLLGRPRHPRLLTPARPRRPHG